MRLFLLGWSLLWTLALPAVLLYLGIRARRDADYGRHLRERFGGYPRPLPGAVWIHAVSLGEMRSAVPLVRALLDRGDRVVTTHFTPAGRREAETVFAAAIADGLLRAVWIPFEFQWAYHRFFDAFRPQFGLAMETESWPRMIAASRQRGIPLFLCNAQYPSRSFARDTTRLGLRAELMTGFAGALVKSELQARRFAAVGVTNIAVTGELRFDQPVPAAQVAAGLTARHWLGAQHRPVVTLASVVAGEDEMFLAAIRESLAAHRERGLPAPLFVYVPRAPERFGTVAGLIAAAGIASARRSALFDRELAPLGLPPDLDLLLGDSLGEMYAYLAMADRVLVGGGFTAKGSHNIAEPLALGKPVMTGPDIHTIEYPAVEAIEAGVCLRLQTPDDLRRALSPDAAPDPSPESIRAFFDGVSGAAEKTLQALARLLTSR
jgi:3-deoxy-D-manno-octulosonic-acid transferase